MNRHCLFFFFGEKSVEICIESDRSLENGNNAIKIDLSILVQGDGRKRDIRNTRKGLRCRSHILEK